MVLLLISWWYEFVWHPGRWKRPGHVLHSV